MSNDTVLNAIDRAKHVRDTVTNGSSRPTAGGRVYALLLELAEAVIEIGEAVHEPQ